MKTNNLFKAIFSFVLILVCFLFLSGCGEETKKEEGSISDIKSWVLETVGVYTTEDLTLPTTHPTLGGEITWNSTDTDILLNDGTIVERGTKAQEVDLGFIIKYNDQIDGENLTIHISPITLDEAVEKFERGLPKKTVEGEVEYFVARDIDIPTNYYGVITVEMNSSDQSIFTNEGKYIKPLNDSEADITVVFSDSYRSLTKNYHLTVYGKSVLEILNEGIDWLDENFNDMLLTASTGLPTSTDNGCSISWSSSNEDVVSSDGKVTESPFVRYVSLTAKVSYQGQYKTEEYFCKVKELDNSTLSSEQKLDAFLTALTPTKVKQVKYNAYGNITQSYNYLYFFDGTGPVITEAIIAPGLGNKSDENRASTNFITVHDTANTNASADAAMHSKYINNGSAGAQTSWHYSVDDHSIYHQVEDDEIAWHAGDGSRTFKLLDTGVKATKGYPLLTFSDDNYFVLGGEKTTIKIPSDTKNKRIGPYGLYMEVGENGNWWMNNAYYNSTYGYICNCGGNRNSVSMESCVNTGSDYVKTFIQTAKLVTYLLRKYDLSCDAIMQHNNFSGKNCPNAIRDADQWAVFRDLCSIMKYGLDNFSDYTFEWQSSDTARLSSEGYITLACKAGEQIFYSVIVKKNNIEVVNKQFSSLLA